jgi:oligoendopeptidase F
VTSVFYSWEFGGSYEDVRRLAHESTHAIQRQLETDRGVKPVYATGPNWEFEATAVFTELALADGLARRAATPEERRFYLERFVSGKGLDTIFVAAAEAMLEEEIYDGVAKGTLRSADDLDALTRKVYGRLSIWAERDPSTASRWMTIPLLYEDPFYDVNYVWAGLAGLGFLERYEKDPEGFGKRYSALLENGFDRPVAELLQRFTGVDIHDPKWVDDALRVSAARVDALERNSGGRESH